MMKRFLTAVAISTVGLFSAQADEGAASCSALLKASLPSASIEAAEVVQAGAFVAPDGEEYQVSDFCRVQGVAKPVPKSHIKFEVWLPLSGWNGRYHQHANGGYSGYFDYNVLAGGVRRGYAMATTDDGHDASQYKATDWALNSPEQVIDHGYRALRETALNSKEVVKLFYGQPANYSYLAGCSRGGGQALQGAQRFPGLWDGILAGAPMMSSTGMFFSAVSNMQPQLNDKPGHIMSAKLPAIQAMAQKSCRSGANLTDGLATDPRLCRFDPSEMVCKGKETDECLTEAQVATLKRIYDGPTREDTGENYFPGFEPTMEAEKAIYRGWEGRLAGDDPTDFYQYRSSSSFFRFIVFSDPDYDYEDINLGSDIAFAESRSFHGQPLASVLNQKNADLTALHTGGGKLLMYTGWGDPAIPPQANIDYFEEVADSMGGIDKAEEFFRLFISPGMLHCFGGPGPNSMGHWMSTPDREFNPDHGLIRALEAWVEVGKAPVRVVATKYKNDDPAQGIATERPLCPYPQLAVYKGSGSTKKAENFTCAPGLTTAEVRKVLSEK